LMTNHRKAMEFSEIDTVLERLGVIYAASEIHGVLCGLLCVKGYVTYDDWIVLLHEEQKIQPGWLKEGANDNKPEDLPPDGEEPAAGEWGLLQDLYDETIRQLNDDDYGFSLLLPDDEQPLRARTEALVEWCDGFLFGLGAGEIKNFAQLPDDVNEISHDLAEISRAYHEDETTEADEVAYAELVEYVRVGVLVIYEALQVTREARAGAKVLH
jgi:uncharacterized protein YgfB (UPF0149 family)